MDNFDALNKKTIQDIMNSWKSDVTPQNGEVIDPKEPPRSRPAYILGNTSFRPFTEPLLKPKMADGPEPYQVYEKSFTPEPRNKDEIFVYDPTHGGELKHQIITPQSESSRDLLKKEQPKEDQLEKLLPTNESAEEFLPAIRLAIKLTLWKKKAVAKLKKLQQQGSIAYKKLKDQISTRASVKAPSQSTPPTAPDVDLSEWHLYEDVIGEALNPKKTRPIGSPSMDLVSTEYMSPVTSGGGPALTRDLEQGYKKLNACLDAWEVYGLLYFRAVLDAQNGDSEKCAKALEVISNWSQLYDLFTSTHVESYSNSRIGVSSCLGYQIKKHSRTHIRIQQLPMAVVAKLPILPDLSDTSYATDVEFCWELVEQLNVACGYLESTLVKFREQLPAKQLDREEKDKIQERIRQIVKDPKFSRVLSGKLRFPGPHFTLEKLIMVPDCVLASIPNKTYSGILDKNLEAPYLVGLTHGICAVTPAVVAAGIDDHLFINEVIDAFLAYLKKAEETFEAL